ncbi:MAG: hypothetical protein HUU37_05505 [Bdellovibrionales bacterium]|nr:hypothetical protein [Bdellovibrionales bacterium]
MLPLILRKRFTNALLALAMIPHLAHAAEGKREEIDSRLEHAVALGLSGSAMTGAIMTEFAVNRTEANISSAVRSAPAAELHEARKKAVSTRLKLEIARREFADVEKRWKSPGADKTALAAEFGHKQKALKKATDAFNHAKHIEDYKKLSMAMADKRERELGKALKTLRLFHYSTRVTGALGTLGTSYSLGALLLEARKKERPVESPLLSNEMELPAHSAE